MEQTKKLYELLDNQKKILVDYEKNLKELDDVDFINENDRLKDEVKNYTNIIDELKKSNKQFSDDNDRLKTALKEQILDEKLNILKISKSPGINCRCRK